MKYEPHRPVKYKCLPWLVCASCGLIYLHNDLTKYCIKSGCNYSDLPNFKDIIKKFTNVNT